MRRLEMARILIVEDEVDLAEGLKDNFEFDGHDVTLAYDGEDGYNKAINERPEIILLDLMLPKKSGLDMCRELRAQGIDIPIIMLTARGQEIDKVLGLELGADDYITKPFSIRELLARVKAVLRRYPDKTKKVDNVQQIGKLTVDFDHYIAYLDGKERDLTHKEFELLKYFMEHQDQTITRDQLMNKIWGYENYPTSRTVDNYIVKLRKKIEEDPAHPSHILTVHGLGYKFIN
jgi:DNA-binding response OmpR family regulator